MVVGDVDAVALTSPIWASNTFSFHNRFQQSVVLKTVEATPSQPLHLPQSMPPTHFPANSMDGTRYKYACSFPRNQR